MFILNVRNLHRLENYDYILSKHILKPVHLMVNLTLWNMEFEGSCIFTQAFYTTAYTPAWPWRGVLFVLLTLPLALLNMAALWAPPCLYRRIAQEKKKDSTALQRVRFSHFFLRIRDRQNRYRIGRRGPGYSLILCCRTATKTGKGWERERWFLEIPSSAG